MFIRHLWENPSLFFMQIWVVVFSICCHEFMHAWVALKQGDSTAADAGHLTLNPFRQMKLLSLVMLVFIGLAWGMVPVNPNRMRHRWSNALVSFAGPSVNLALFVLSGLAIGINAAFIANPSVHLLFLICGGINMVLFVINMIPVPGFDGWHVVSYFLPKIQSGTNELKTGIGLSLIILIFLFIDRISSFGFNATLWIGSNVRDILSLT
ncbi:MAG: site-2 protease family protein [Victivallaceae bacterium]|jgi:Zn-dependent protease|nr:site-2 protease family protein [Victivallaceae bacterium]MDD3117049.1 site-2 protease family protein [Victivallaceae bacterium]MDD4317488.1 site-2 protease family protein [Victivallaceae bacterium]MDD5664371.1 site-2 protease family protein [Victivallaceae bacterium]NLK84009.1 site-2 protease family protein [Lentisphaerota bacterium]